MYCTHWRFMLKYKMINQMKNKEGGFLQLIILIVVLFFVIKYFHISASDVYDWFVTLIQTLFSKLNF